MVPDEPVVRPGAGELFPDQTAAKPLTKAQRAGVLASVTKKANLAKKALEENLAAEEAKTAKES
jgi:hypothetical protein